MFGYIGENSTPDGGHTNRAEVNKLGDLFGGKGVWLPKGNPNLTLRGELEQLCRVTDYAE